MVSEGKSYPLGVWAYYSDGSIRDYDNADSNAIGVAVVTNNCAFVINKTAIPTTQFGGYNTDLSGSGAFTTTNFATSQSDYDGEGNTEKLKPYITDTSTTFVKCTQAFGGKGYVGAAGEWKEVFNNKDSVKNMMTKIGGSNFLTNQYYWTSTLYNGNQRNWTINMNSNNARNDLRSATGSMRCNAFMKL
jgi:hypothetical protein